MIAKLNPNVRGTIESLLTGIDYNDSGSKAMDFAAEWSLAVAENLIP